MSSYRPYLQPTLAQFRAALGMRLSDSAGPNQFWPDAERTLYITEALRMWNALTGQWLVDFAFFTTGNVWYSIPTLTGTPRPYTLTSNDLFTLMEYHLLEPPTGGVWTGTTQFTITALAQALQRRRDETLQAAGLGFQNFQLQARVGDRRVFLPGAQALGLNYIVLQSPSQDPLILADGGGGYWLVTIEPGGQLQTAAVAGGPAATPVLQDLATGQYWQMGVTTHGILTT